MRGKVSGAVAALVATVAAASIALSMAPSRGGAQSAPARREFQRSVEAYLAQYSLDDGTGLAKRRVGGFGLRLTFNRPRPDRDATTILDRADGSIFATYTTRQGTPNASTLHAGLQTDFAVLPRAAGGVFDPFFGMSLGIFRSSIEAQLGGRGRVNRSDLALSPGVGTRIHFVNGIGARGDVRVPLVFGTNTTANVVTEGGIYVSF